MTKRQRKVVEYLAGICTSIGFAIVAYVAMRFQNEAFASASVVLALLSAAATAVLVPIREELLKISSQLESARTEATRDKARVEHQLEDLSALLERDWAREMREAERRRAMAEENRLKQRVQELSPDLFLAWHNVAFAESGSDLYLPTVAHSIYNRMIDSYTAIQGAAEAELRDESFFDRLVAEVEEMEEGDRLIAVCGRKFWAHDSNEFVERYWRANHAAVSRSVLVMRAFVADGSTRHQEFSDEICMTMWKHYAFRHFLRRTARMEKANEVWDLSRRLKVRVIREAARNTIKGETWLDPRFGFSLISKQGRQLTTLHRLVENDQHLQGVIIEDPFVFAAFEQHFWKVWGVGKDLTKARMEQLGGHHSSAFLSWFKIYRRDLPRRVV